MDKITFPEQDATFAKFKLGKFINETPIYARDKRGLNISILIIQVLFLIQAQRYEVAEEKIDALKKYCVRYLTHDDTLRSNSFMRMLIQLPKVHFHYNTIGRSIKIYLEKLQNTPLEIAHQPHNIEIIPYEDLWVFVLQSLSGRKK